MTLILLVLAAIVAVIVTVIVGLWVVFVRVPGTFFEFAFRLLAPFQVAFSLLMLVLIQVLLFFDGDDGDLNKYWRTGY